MYRLWANFLGGCQECLTGKIAFENLSFKCSHYLIIFEKETSHFGVEKSFVLKFSSVVDERNFPCDRAKIRNSHYSGDIHNQTLPNQTYIPTIYIPTTLNLQLETN